MTGSYAWAWKGLIGIGLLAFLLQWPMDDRSVAERTSRAAEALGA